MAKPTPKNPVILPTQKRSVITFENILEATTYLIEEIGIQKITTNKIADRSGVNINSLYQYFLDKNAIIRLITERLLEENETAFRQSLRNSTGLKNKERALAIIQDSLNIFTRRPNLNREILLYMPLIIGLEKQEQIGNLLAKSLLEVIPNELYPSDKTKQIAAEMLVHTFLNGAILLLSPNLSGQEQKLKSNELRHMLLRYIGINELSPRNYQEYFHYVPSNQST